MVSKQGPAMILALCLLLLPFAFTSPTGLSGEDIDSDGIKDSLERALLIKFSPEFMLSTEECDALPSEFIPGGQAPQLLAKNGTIYGQVFPVAFSGKPGFFIEIHYYHLWEWDCGINGHAFDAEHVSVLLSAYAFSDSANDWRAAYWYAAAHEKTVCDAGHGTSGSFINAERQGPTVWISAGKHASYLDRELCRGGCGGDDCSRMRPMNISRLINLGEPGAPLNGASWIEWQGWPLADKMQTDFPEKVLAILNASDRHGMIPVNDSQAPVKGTILVSSATAGALGSTNRKTGAALSTAGEAVGKSLDKSKTGTGTALTRTFRAIWKALGGGAEEKPDETEP
ncbi:MAG: hypothetical protein JXR49_00505 [Acidobacteria bacterium]|nr:hypothetical protein [Acidobacteriota bacterium]